MKMRSACLAALCGLGLMTVAGCPTGATERLSNGGGGSVVSAGLKVAGGNLSTLTQDEIQSLSDTANKVSAEYNIELSDEEADAISDFLVENKLNTIADIRNAVNNPEGLVIPPSVQSFIDSGAIPGL